MLTEAMIEAVDANKVADVVALLDAGEDINAKNDAGETAFSYACASDSFEVAEMLYERGADINTVDAGGGTPLDWADQWSSSEFIEWLEGVGGKRNS